ncbi:hypothetical protein NW768_010064 [Fusarium equiseti]|uniref:Uncharacterized protein n=1 Tax=Fusarium equiseti TaxID=61235 RepID=A0ABQ8R1W4_FUSEQ|nr:hypothetical protein NW768_010064 [Fusarium equiseti]
MSSQVEEADDVRQVKQRFEQTINQLAALGWAIVDIKKKMGELERENANLQTELNGGRVPSPQVQATSQQAQACQEEFIMFQEIFGRLIFALETVSAETARLTKELTKEVQSQEEKYEEQQGILIRLMQQVCEITEGHGYVTSEGVRNLIDRAKIELLGGPSEGSG